MFPKSVEFQPTSSYYLYLLWSQVSIFDSAKF